MTYSLDRMVEASKRFGLTVEVVPGAETRSAGSFNPHGFVGHHTAGAKTGVRPSLALCVNGRSDLSGPLCNDFLDRNGVDVIVACGRANHAGLGGFRGIVGNSGVWGCEAEDDGDGVWTDAQLDAYPRLVAARLWLLGRDESWYCSHRTWALEPPSWPGRKTDPAGIADAWMRARVAPLLAAGSAGATVTPGGSDMPLDQTDLNNIKTVVRNVLNEGTAAGQASWADTSKATLASVQGVVNLVNKTTGSLATQVTDARTAVLAAVAAQPTGGITDEQRQQLAADIAGLLAEHGVTVDSAAVAEALATDLAARLSA